MNDMAQIGSRGTREVVGRFAPTPSGRMHLGNAFSCLVAWLGVRSAGGRMILRIENLDPRAHDRQYAEKLMDDLRWLGLDWDEGPYWQSERFQVYEEALRTLEARGLTYPCFCTRAQLHAATAPHASDGTYIYQGTCRKLSPQEVAARQQQREPATRLRVPAASDPQGTIAFDDLVYGHHEENLAQECGDFLIRRSDGIFAYQLAVSVDDALMAVTQVVRAMDLLGSTARQIYLHQLLGFEPPTFAHVPLLIARDGRRLSKRDGDLDLGALRDAGYSAERIVGRLAQAIGLAAAGEELTPAQLVGRFSWEAVRQHRNNIVVDTTFLL